MDKKDTSRAKVERWTARRKSDLVLEIIKGQKTIVDAAREYDLKQSEIMDSLTGLERDKMREFRQNILN